MSKIKILDIPLDDTDGFTTKLNMLLTWSITPHQYGDHRPYAVATLLSRWVDHSENRALRRGLAPPDEMLQDRLFDWLDSSNVVTHASTLPAMTIMFGELICRGLFSYSKYIQRLIARGESGLLVTQVPRSVISRMKMYHLSLLSFLGTVFQTPCHLKVSSSY
jgi:mediator of RNA polymerase II transcription subunit 12, fungi type